MTPTDLFDFDYKTCLPSPRVLPTGWKVTTDERRAVNPRLVLAFMHLDPPIPDEEQGLAEILIRGIPRAPELLPPNTRPVLGMLAIARAGHLCGVLIQGLEVHAAKRRTKAETREHYAMCLLDLLTFFPGLAGDGWRELRKQLTAHEATKGDRDE